MSNQFLCINKLLFSYPTSSVTLFDGFNTQFASGWTCVAGSNETGKTTLLNLIQGVLEPSSGKISIDGKTVDVSYCEQECVLLPENAYSAFWDSDNSVRKFFSLLKITEDYFERWETLSGGEKKRVQIACALAEQKNVLLLDEPANHLDESSKELILSALEAFTGIGIVVSHDREFSDKLCSSTLYLYREENEIAGGRECVCGKMYQANLSKTIELRKNESSAFLAEWNLANAATQKAKTLVDVWERKAAQSDKRLSMAGREKSDGDMKGKRNRAVISGKDRGPGDVKSAFESRMQQSQENLSSLAKPLARKEGFSIKSDAKDFVPKVLIHLDEQKIVVGTYTLSIPEINVERTSKIALTGVNGAGKTLFIKTLLKNAPENKKGIFYLPQEIDSIEEENAIRKFQESTSDVKGEILSTLYRLGSEPKALIATENLVKDKIKISPGELRKLMISEAVVFSEQEGIENLRLLILDEPTNHMDIVSIRALEEAFKNLSCALIVISHDSIFLSELTYEEFHISRIKNYGTLEKKLH